MSGEEDFSNEQQLSWSDTGSIEYDVNDNVNELENFDDLPQLINKFPIHVQVHVTIACVIYFIYTLILHWVAIGTSLDVLWWWFFPLFFFGITLTFHYYFYQKKYWKGIIISVIVTNVACFLLWAFDIHYQNVQKNEEGVQYNPWWIFIFSISLILLTIGYYAKNRTAKTFHRMVLNLYWQVNVSVFFIWLFFTQGFPWFVIILLITTTIVVFIRLYFIHKIKKIWIYVLSLSSVMSFSSLVFGTFSIETTFFLLIGIILFGIIITTITYFVEKKMFPSHFESRRHSDPEIIVEEEP